jgi:hypothetical protein
LPNKLLAGAFDAWPFPVGGGPAGVVELKVNVFAGAGVVEPTGADVDVVLEVAPNRLEPEGLFRLEKSPPACVVPLALFSAFKVVEAPLSSFFCGRLKVELGVAGLLNRPPIDPDELVAGFVPNVVGAFPVLPPKSGVDVPEPGLEVKIDPCCTPLVFEVAPNGLAPEVAPPPKRLIVGFDVAVAG